MCKWQPMKDESKSYHGYFSMPRPAFPQDLTPISNYTTQHSGLSYQLTMLHQFDAQTLTHTLAEGVCLDLAFVSKTIRLYGPTLDNVVAQSEWQWTVPPRNVTDTISNEQSLYPFLEWVIYGPAAQALPSILDHLWRTAGGLNPLPMFSNVTLLDSQLVYGSADLVQFWSHRKRANYREGIVKVAHEVKRARVLMVGEENVLDQMYDLARLGWKFRIDRSCKNGTKLLYQVH